MITHHPEFSDEPTDVLVNDVLGKPCFYCGDATRHPAVVWSGYQDPPRIVLHPACARELASHLILDSYIASHDRIDLQNMVRRITARLEGGST